MAIRFNIADFNNSEGLPPGIVQKLNHNFHNVSNLLNGSGIERIVEVVREEVEPYTLPPATPVTLGGIKVGSNLSVAQDGTLSADAQQYVLPPATQAALGGIKVGSNLSIAQDGTLSADAQQYTLPTASANTLGGVKVGNNLSIDQNGVLSATGSGEGVPDGGTAGQVLAKASNADQDTEWTDYMPTYIQSSAPDANSTYPAASIMPCFAYYPVDNSLYYCVDAGGGRMTATRLNSPLSAYPVGSIYMSVNSTDPGTLFGGSWQRITGRFLLAATDGGSSGASQNAGNTGGAATVQLGTANIPKMFWHTDSLTGDNLHVSFNQGLNYGMHTNPSSKTGDAHNNMPPFLAVYIWKRTA